MDKNLLKDLENIGFFGYNGIDIISEEGILWQKKKIVVKLL